MWHLTHFTPLSLFFRPPLHPSSPPPLSLSLSLSHSLTLTHSYVHTPTSSNTVVEVISISDPEVSPNQISVTCTIVGYPNPSVEWLAPSSGMVTSNIRTTVNPETYETTVRATITVSRNCQGSYRCRARNTDQSTRITTIVSDNFCDRGELQFTFGCVYGCI